MAGKTAEEHDLIEKVSKAYAKTAELKPGESQTMSICFPVSELASYDEAQAAWVTDEGTYRILVAASSADIRSELELDVKGSVR